MYVSAFLKDSLNACEIYEVETKDYMQILCKFMAFFLRNPTIN